MDRLLLRALGAALAIALAFTGSALGASGADPPDPPPATPAGIPPATSRTTSVTTSAETAPANPPVTDPLEVSVHPAPIRGLYLPTGRLLEGIPEAQWALWKQLGLNGLVVDLKNDGGWVIAADGLDSVRRMRSRWSPGLDLAALTREARERGFYPIARIVALMDPRAATAQPELALLDLQGRVWADPRKQRWLDPTKEGVWHYLADLTRQAAALGFEEVQLDYIRFPSEGRLDRLAWPASRSKTEAVAQTLRAVREAADRAGITLSIALFGQSCNVTTDMGIGQRCEELAPLADVVSPMAYPSHYAPGSFGLRDPEAQPGPLVQATLQEAGRRLNPLTLRPWLQAFSLRVSYGAPEVAAQIRAAEEAGTGGWLLWNAAGRYPMLAEVVQILERERGALVALAGGPPSRARRVDAVGVELGSASAEVGTVPVNAGAGLAGTGVARAAEEAGAAGPAGARPASTAGSEDGAPAPSQAD